MTVALDTAGADAARPFIERAQREAKRSARPTTQPTHPSLIDQAHVLDELFGVTNVPMGIWIDEDQTIVRPPEPATPRRPRSDRPIPEDLPERLREMLTEARKIRIDPDTYIAALRDWVANGSDSVYALEPHDVIARSRPRPAEAALAAANFELGQYLWREGHERDAVGYFREAHRLEPDNWTYKRQAWTFADPLQGPSEDYEGDWLSDVRKIGAENYYPPLRMP